MRHAPFLLLPLMLVACADVTGEDPSHSHEGELITTVELTLTAAGEAPIVVAWADLDQTGSPSVEPLALTAGTAYDLEVRFLDELSEPVEDITPEIRDEGDQHQLFFTGPDLGTLLVHSYGDTDVEGLPVGLVGTLEALAAGTTELVVTLQHLPPEDSGAVKVAGLAEVAADEGLGALPGDTDASVTFPVTID